jgi:hypothetical protein
LFHIFKISYIGFFGGLQPLCGTGVTSLIALIEIPADSILLIAVSLPEPIPLTLTVTILRPKSLEVLAALAAAIPAEYGVFFLEPL